MTATPRRLTLALAVLIAAGSVAAGVREDARADDATRVLKQIQAIPESSIPDRLLEDAKGIVVVPDTIKAGFMLGGRRGLGLMAVKTPQGTWSNPVYVKLSGASFGLQAGVQSADVILVFRSERGLDNIVNGKFTLGADAGVAAGPVGRNAAAATDGAMKAEIWSWSRARGLFAGIALDGAVLQIDNGANASAYGAGSTPRMIFEGRAVQPPSPTITAFRNMLEEATAAARYARQRANPTPAADPGAATVQPLESHSPATAAPLPSTQPSVPVPVKP
ncbi:MAG: lipid-binding SYLF domain-containing protein [Xanthomonadaceae bacterium]|nr:lipid-binding SYLF domain-containing protein [Xanthomonadaceae bacterium]